VTVAAWCARYLPLRPVAFGLWWFLIALAPTSLFPLAEVENDHRMFFPFVGLSLAVCYAAVTLIPASPRWLAGGAAVILVAGALATRERNRVWRNEETLWRDVTEKSPRNGRGLMNYGLTLMAKGQTEEALSYFVRAFQFTPNYPILEINLGIATGELKRDREAEQHFQRAIALAPRDALGHYYYGRWLRGKNRIVEAQTELQAAVDINPTLLTAQYLLMEIFAAQGNWAHLAQRAGEVLRMAPGDAVAQGQLERARTGMEEAGKVESATRAKPTPEGFLSLSLQYHRAGRYDECIAAAREALKMRPDYPEAWNNIAAGYQSKGQWEEAIRAAEEALRLKPDFELARSNLAWSREQKRLAAGRGAR
jgi:tetratricopeptide (TPR) repeat protein